MWRQELSEDDLTKRLIREYYTTADLKLPDDFILREFAYQTYDEMVYVRHLSFQTISSLRDFLVREAPRQIYYSAAKYRDPAAESMEDKGWLGSELMFDIDADHLPGCEPCQFEIKLIDKSIKKVSIPNSKCIELAKNEELKLLDILKSDFGFTDSEIKVYFSGNRGFHTIVSPSDEDWLRLNPYQRRELVDYIIGHGLDLKRLFPIKRKNVELLPLSGYMGGWRKRLAKANVDYNSLHEDLESLIEVLKIHIDEQVTQDVSRLIRIPGSINGKSGLPAIEFSSESDLISFQYGDHLSPFKGHAVIVVRKTVRKTVSVFNVRIKLVEGHRLKVSLPIAVYLSLNFLCTIHEIL